MVTTITEGGNRRNETLLSSYYENINDINYIKTKINQGGDAL